MYHSNFVGSAGIFTSSGGQPMVLKIPEHIDDADTGSI
jgi:hypothetical protein